MIKRAQTHTHDSPLRIHPHPKRQISLKTALALVPLLSLCLTGATFAIPFVVKVLQSYTQGQQREEIDWEKVFGKIATDQGTNAAADAVSLERFAHTRHEAQARETEARLLTKIDDKDSFDTLFSDWLSGVTQENQKEVFRIDATIAGQLKDLYRFALKNGNSGLPIDKSFADFLDDPDLYLFDADARERANAKIWELDTITTGLDVMWTGKMRRAITPSGENLSHMVFLSNSSEMNDFRSVNFRDAANMTDVAFYGNCAIDREKLPANITSECNK